jgi:hypothetical protein
VVSLEVEGRNKSNGSSILWSLSSEVEVKSVGEEEREFEDA